MYGINPCYRVLPKTNLLTDPNCPAITNLRIDEHPRYTRGALVAGRFSR